MDRLDTAKLINDIRDEAFRRMEQAFYCGNIEQARQIQDMEWMPLVRLCQLEGGAS